MPAKKSTTTKAKTTAKKKPSSSKAKTAAKKPVSKKAATSRAKKQPVARSFHLSAETEPFVTTRVNAQTFYWVVLGVIVIAFSLWINHLNTQIQDLYDIVDRNIAESTYMNSSYATQLQQNLKDN